MSLAYSYKPVQFYLATFVCTWIPWFIAAYLSHQRGKEKLQLLCMLTGLLVPFIAALVMIYASRNHRLIQDFWHRLFLYRIDQSSLFIIFVAIPAAFFGGVALSLLFGKSVEQFELAKELNVMKGWQTLSLLIPVFFAPALEELGWRGYGVDSLRSNFNLFYTSMLFAFLWGLWHLPMFFVKGYYHHELWNLNIIYVINFFISMIPAAILINWIYYRNNRSIMIAILVHALFNALAVFFKAEQFTKCIITVLLCGVSAVVVFFDKAFFFAK